VQDRAHARHAEVQLEVLLMVPAERGNPFPLLYAQGGQCAGQPLAVRVTISFLPNSRLARSSIGSNVSGYSIIMPRMRASSQP
jgi:hypothetical protein